MAIFLLFIIFHITYGYAIKGAIGEKIKICFHIQFQLRMLAFHTGMPVHVSVVISG